MKVIFLDIDGVLNSGYTKERIEGYTFVDASNIRFLKELIDQTGAKVVLSSTWRRGWALLDTRDEESLTSSEKQDIRLFEALKARLLEYGIELMSYTRDFAQRGTEIDAWLKEWTGEPIEAFVILDDMDDWELKPHGDHLVQTGFYAGLEPKNVRRALDVLNKGE